MQAQKTRVRHVALCFFLLAVAAIVWTAAERREQEPEELTNYAALGNSFARISSGRAEVFSASGELAYAVDCGAERLEPCGEAAAAWSPGGRLVFLGAGGYREAGTHGELLGVFGSESGAACALWLGPDGARVSVYGAAGEAAHICPGDGIFPLAAAISPRLDAAAVLGADSEGYVLLEYSLPGLELRASARLDSPAYTLIWGEDGPRAVEL